MKEVVVEYRVSTLVTNIGGHVDGEAWRGSGNGELLVENLSIDSVKVLSANDLVTAVKPQPDDERRYYFSRFSNGQPVEEGH